MNCRSSDTLKGKNGLTDLNICFCSVHFNTKVVKKKNNKENPSCSRYFYMEKFNSPPI